MPSYAAPADIAKYALTASMLVEFSSQEQQDALDAASSLADSYLSKRFSLPLQSWGLDLRRSVASLAAYDLMAVRGYNPQDGDNDTIRDRHDDAIKWLTAIANGDVTPVVSDSGTHNPQTAPYVLNAPQGASGEAEDFWGHGIGEPLGKRRGF